jgi:hypothetical protein
MKTRKPSWLDVRTYTHFSVYLIRSGMVIYIIILFSVSWCVYLSALRQAAPTMLSCVYSSVVHFAGHIHNPTKCCR